MIRELLPPDFPELLKEITDPPARLRYDGELPKKDNKLLAIVGSRKYSSYGREVCESLIAGLSGAPVTIVSGLALGIDSIAHRAAMRADLQTIAIPGSGLDRKVLHPHSHVKLAEEIIENGGGLISEYDDLMPAGAWAFPRRNRIMAGLCTALIRDHNDVRELLGLKRTDEHPTLVDIEDLSDEEKIFIKILETPCSRDELIRKSKLDIGSASATLSLLEIKGLITEELGEVRKIF